jgi:hypothetical protein
MSIRRIAYERKIYSTDDANGPTALPRYSLTLRFAAMASGAASMRRRFAHSSGVGRGIHGLGLGDLFYLFGEGMLFQFK